ncbi:MAG: hypothetical protein ABSF51_09780 [Verrucomicrobiota bacterium]|jgi:hypothetical protein
MQRILNNEPTYVGCYDKRAARSGIIATWFLLTQMALGPFAVARAQSNTMSHASDFMSVEYYPAPNQQQMRSRLSGAEAQPLPGGLLAIKELKLETFGLDGQPEIVVNAPECTYDQLNGTASSPGRLQVQYQEGKIRVEGEGFLWRQSDSFLTISNRVSTVLELGPEKKN